MIDFNNYYTILRNTNYCLNEMKKRGFKKSDLILVLPGEWKEILLNRNKLLGLDIIYNDTICGLKHGKIIDKNSSICGFEIPKSAFPDKNKTNKLALSIGELN